MKTSELHHQYDHLPSPHPAIKDHDASAAPQPFAKPDASSKREAASLVDTGPQHFKEILANWKDLARANNPSSSHSATEASTRGEDLIQTRSSTFSNLLEVWRKALRSGSDVQNSLPGRTAHPHLGKTENGVVMNRAKVAMTVTSPPNLEKNIVGGSTSGVSRVEKTGGHPKHESHQVKLSESASAIALATNKNSEETILGGSASEVEKVEKARERLKHASHRTKLIESTVIASYVLPEDVAQKLLRNVRYQQINKLQPVIAGLDRWRLHVLSMIFNKSTPKLYTFPVHPAKVGKEVTGASLEGTKTFRKDPSVPKNQNLQLGVSAHSEIDSTSAKPLKAFLLENPKALPHNPTSQNEFFTGPKAAPSHVPALPDNILVPELRSDLITNPLTRLQYQDPEGLMLKSSGSMPIRKLILLNSIQKLQQNKQYMIIISKLGDKKPLLGVTLLQTNNYSKTRTITQLVLNPVVFRDLAILFKALFNRNRGFQNFFDARKVAPPPGLKYSRGMLGTISRQTRPIQELERFPKALASRPPSGDVIPINKSPFESPSRPESHMSSHSSNNEGSSPSSTFSGQLNHQITPLTKDRGPSAETGDKMSSRIGAERLTIVLSIMQVMTATARKALSAMSHKQALIASKTKPRSSDTSGVYRVISTLGSWLQSSREHPRTVLPQGSLTGRWRRLITGEPKTPPLGQRIGEESKPPVSQSGPPLSQIGDHTLNSAVGGLVNGEDSGTMKPNVEAPRVHPIKALQVNHQLENMGNPQGPAQHERTRSSMMLISTLRNRRPFSSVEPLKNTDLERSHLSNHLFVGPEILRKRFWVGTALLRPIGKAQRIFEGFGSNLRDAQNSFKSGLSSKKLTPVQKSSPPTSTPHFGREEKPGGIEGLTSGRIEIQPTSPEAAGAKSNYEKSLHSKEGSNPPDVPSPSQIHQHAKDAETIVSSSPETREPPNWPLNKGLKSPITMSLSNDRLPSKRISQQPQLARADYPEVLEKDPIIISENSQPPAEKSLRQKLEELNYNDQYLSPAVAPEKQTRGLLLKDRRRKPSTTPKWWIILKNHLAKPFEAIKRILTLSHHMRSSSPPI